MIEFSIVKNALNEDWLPLPGLNRDERAQLAQLILQNETGDVQRLSSTLTSRLSPAARSYLNEKATQIAGQPARLLMLLADLPATPPDSAEDLALWEERYFLRGFALSRMGEERAAATIFQSLPGRFRPLIQCERALVQLNKGRLSTAESAFREAMTSGAGAFDPYAACSALGGLSLALIHQGDFSAAELCLHARRQILAAHASPSLAFGTRLYEILLLLERNDFQGAAALLQRSLGEVRDSSVNGFFLLHLELRLQLARNRLAEAESALARLKTLAAELQLPDGVLDYRLEEIEWNLRSGAAAPAMAAIEIIEARGRAAKDEFLVFRVLILKALATLKRSQPVEALSEIERAIEIGEEYRYRPALSWAFFHAAGIASSAGSSVKARLFLNRGRRVARELRLVVRSAAFAYMADVLDNRYAGASALVGLAKYREIGPELEYFLEAYRLLASVSVLVNDGQGQSAIDEPVLRRKLFREPGFFWFQKEGVLVANRDSHAVVAVELRARSPLLAAFRLFWTDFLQRTQASNKGLGLKDVHKARTGTSYREELHAAAAKMLISRLRQTLSPAGITVIYDRTTGRYLLSSAAPLPAFTIQSRTEGFEPTSVPRSREDEVMARISMEPFVSTSVLCQEFGISRQALHPTLRKLVRERRVRMVKRGPVSGYVSLEA